MIETLLIHILTFLGVFALLSLIRLVVTFLKALLSNPPKPFDLERSALIYYGICISFLVTLILDII
jgi:hypothetical protein